ncbi:MAG: glycosyltransferase family 4 protein [Candidatus Schekmanbacteria bacterium]|nr:glycosyltransferase family 4 protein [Candidatus Schekmanbacteria bacterium]
MKIALIRQKYSSHGGAERYLQQLIDGLLQEGHEVHLFANVWQEQKGVIFHQVKMIKGFSFIKALSFAYFVKKALAKERFDLVHSLERTIGQDIYRAGDGCHKEWLKQRRRINPWRLTMFDCINPLHLALLWLEKRLYHYPDTKYIIANSARGKQEIINLYYYPAEKIEVIYNGVDLQRFHPRLRTEYRQKIRRQLGIDDQTFVMLWVGSGFRRKGMKYLLEALDTLWTEGNKSWFLLVAGKDKIKKYQDKIKDKEWRRQVIFPGPQKEVGQYYGAADVYILPSIYEPFANTCLEALACGLPVITSAINGASEILTAQTGSIIDNPVDIRQIADRIKHWQEVERLKTAVSAGRVLAEKYSIQQNVQKTIAVYRKTITNVTPGNHRI